MTPASILLGDAEATLQRTSQIGELSPLQVAFIAWLQNQPPPQCLADALNPPLRRHEDVAIACLAEVAGWVINKSNLDDGLNWITEVTLERAGIPIPIVSDGLAQIAIGLAIKSHPHLKAWHDRVITFGAQSVTPLWLAGGGLAARGSTISGTIELRLALASRGVVANNDLNASIFLDGLKQGQLPEDAFHSQILMIALEWTRRSTPIILPNHATAQTVARLLSEIPRSLQQWVWESKPKTKNSQTAKWHIENEYHVQALLWAILAPIFPDLKREDPAPSIGPIQPRTDFGIPSLRLLIEAKFTRSRAALKNTVNEIAQDNSNYFAGPYPYDKMLVFIWDNGAYSEDHALVVEGLRKFDRVADVVIVSRPGHMMETATDLDQDSISSPSSSNDR